MGEEAELRPGTLTLLMTDIEGSSRLWELDEQHMKESVARHDSLIRKAVETYGGIQPLEQGEGDSTLTAFNKPSDALACVLDIQKAFIAEDWQPNCTIRIRAALHTGEVELRDARRYWGPSINRCARIRSIGHGAQTLLSRVTRDLVTDHLPSHVSLKDLGVHRLRDLSSPEHVFQLSHPDLQTEFPPLLSLDAFPNNLPLQLKSFIPREEVMEQVRRRLGSNRVVTLTGAGGSGKTRLALQAAADALESYPGGVWLVDLAPITDPDLVTDSVAKAVRIPVAGGTTSVASDARPTIDGLIDFLRVRRALLILDNCEHLLDACTDLAEILLQTCPDLALLVTSREPLGLEGESIWRVPSMRTPGHGDSALPDQLTSYEAVNLFLDRASLARPGFEINSENAASVVDIVRRLDGIPLAIELAAARVNVLSPRQIASMLDDSFRLLAGGGRKTLERQQTIRASIEWSYKHLPENEQILFRRLSVFAGGAGLEAVEHICSDDLVRAGDILDLLSHLVQKSLLEAVESAGNVRYRFLEMIRQYAREVLNESGESELIRSRHRDFFMEFVEEAELGVRSGDETPWLESLDREHDNVRMAFEWSRDNRQKEQSLRIASNLLWYWFQRFIREEGWSWMDSALQLEGNVSPELMGRAYLAKFYTGMLAGRPSAEGRKAAEMSVAAFDEFSSEPHPLKSHALMVLALNTRGWTLFDRAAAEARELGEAGDGYSRSLALLAEGISAVFRSETEKALRLFEAAYDAARSAGTIHFSMDIASFWLIRTARDAGDYERAGRYAEEALSFWRERQVEIKIAYALNELGYVSLKKKEIDEARAHISQSLRMLEKLGDARDIANVTHSLGEVEEAAGNEELARNLFYQSLNLSRQAGFVSGITDSLFGLARVSEDPNESVRHLVEVLRLERGSSSMAAWVRRVAQALVRAARPELAVVLFGAHDNDRKKSPGAIPFEERGDYEAALERAREELGETRFTALWNEGAKLELEDAVDLALKATPE